MTGRSFQIDQLGRCCTGKIMKYDPRTGHRIKDEKTAVICAGLMPRYLWIATVLETTNHS